jgi:hypothetical protein
MTGVVGPVYASKRLFTKLDFQSDKGLESATSGLSRFWPPILTFLDIGTRYAHVLDNSNVPFPSHLVDFIRLV